MVLMFVALTTGHQPGNRAPSSTIWLHTVPSSTWSDIELGTTMIYVTKMKANNSIAEENGNYSFENCTHTIHTRHHINRGKIKTLSQAHDKTNCRPDGGFRKIKRGAVDTGHSMGSKTNYRFLSITPSFMEQEKCHFFKVDNSRPHLRQVLSGANASHVYEIQLFPSRYL